MASPCEVLVDGDDRRVARRVLSIVATEARRIEAKFSRYRNDSIVSRINRCDGDVEVDDGDGPAARLFRTAVRAQRRHVRRHLRRPATHGASMAAIECPTARRPRTATRTWAGRASDGAAAKVALQPGMEIDFGGIAKEYAVDSSALLVASAIPSGELPGQLRRRSCGQRSAKRRWKLARGHRGGRAANPAPPREESFGWSAAGWRRAATRGASFSRMACATPTSSTRPPVGRFATRRDR